MDSLLANDSVNIFSSSTHSFEVESVTFVPYDGSTERTISVQVFRPSTLLDFQYLMLYIPRDATSGVTDVNVGGDGIRMAFRRGDDAVLHKITRLESEDAGGFFVAVQ